MPYFLLGLLGGGTITYAASNTSDKLIALALIGGAYYMYAYKK